MPRVRVFVDHAGQLRRACDVTVTNTDASIYITPSSRERRYNFGRASISTIAQSATFSVLGQLEASEDPHVSLHQSGQVHIRTKGGPKAGPLRIPPLQHLRGGHVATVTCDTIEGFPIYNGNREDLNLERDCIVYVADGVPSGRIAFYINGERPDFVAPADRIGYTIQVANRMLARPLFVGIAPWGQAALGDDETSETVVAIAGFLPDGSGDDLLFLRGL